MVRRHASSSFGGAYAFPGGVLEDVDRLVSVHCHGITAAQADSVLGVDAGGLDYYSAAVRELFEETGVLLAQTTTDAEALDIARQGLNDGSLRWDRFVSERNARLQCDALHYFSFWITPIALPKRYSTRFFVAELPQGQCARHCGGELTESSWMTADAALQARRDDDITLHYPTKKTLESIARFQSLDALVDWARSCAKAGVPCIFPEIRSDGSARRIIVDGEDTTEIAQ